MLKECCKVPENLKVIEQREDVVVRQCQECGCRHFEVTLEPGLLSAELIKLG